MWFPPDYQLALASKRTPSIFDAKNTQNYREYRVAYATVYLNEAPTGHSSTVEQAKMGH